MQKFLTDTIENRFIKALLYNTPLPTYRTVSEGDYILAGSKYIYNNDLIKCRTSGYISSKEYYVWEQYTLKIIESQTLDNTLINNQNFIWYADSIKLNDDGVIILVDPKKLWIYDDTTFKECQDILTHKYVISNEIYKHYLLVSKDDKIFKPTDFDGIEFISDSIPEWSNGDYNVYYINSVNSLNNKKIYCNVTEHIQAKDQLIATFETESKDDYPLDGRLHQYWYTYKETIYPSNYDVLKSYIFSHSYTKYTSNYISENNYYDSDTHIRLGEYLRCYRDLYKIDLMPFYNCYCDKYTSEFYLTSTAIIPRTNNNFKIIEVPIKFNKTYTIAIDSSSQVIICPALISNGDTIYINDTDISKQLYSIDGNIVSYTSTSFSQPFTYTLKNRDTYLEQFEKNLVILIQLPKNNNSSIVVLEGDYTNTSTRKIIDLAGMYNLSSTELNKVFLSNLSLLKMNDNNSYAFTDRLIEYLLNNVITKEDEITYNIKRVQDDIKYESIYDNVIEDVWDDRLRKQLFDTYTKKYNNATDINGYVDKDMEKFLLRKRAGN